MESLAKLSLSLNFDKRAVRRCRSRKKSFWVAFFSKRAEEGAEPFQFLIASVAKRLNSFSSYLVLDPVFSHLVLLWNTFSVGFAGWLCFCLNF